MLQVLHKAPERQNTKWILLEQDFTFTAVVVEALSVQRIVLFHTLLLATAAKQEQMFEHDEMFVLKSKKTIEKQILILTDKNLGGPAYVSSE